MTIGMQEKSDENWQVGNDCLDADHVNAAANRIYYAVFQAVLLFALDRKGYVRKGYGVHNDMARFVDAEGKTRYSSGRAFRRLMALRVTADYEVEPVNQARLRKLLGDADAIRRHFLRLVTQ